jgi:hypothetical protein
MSVVSFTDMTTVIFMMADVHDGSDDYGVHDSFNHWCVRGVHDDFNDCDVCDVLSD